MKFMQFVATSRGFATKYFEQRSEGTPPLAQAGYRHSGVWYFVVSTASQFLHISHDTNGVTLVREATITDDGFANTKVTEYTQAQFEDMAK